VLQGSLRRPKRDGRVVGSRRAGLDGNGQSPPHEHGRAKISRAGGIALRQPRLKVPRRKGSSNRRYDSVEAGQRELIIGDRKRRQDSDCG